MRLRGQYTMVIGGLVCSSLLVLGATLLAQQGRHAGELGAVAADNLADALERRIEKDGVAQAVALANRLVPSFLTDDRAWMAHEAAEHASNPGILSATVVDEHCRIIRDGGDVDLSDDKPFDLPWVHKALETGQAASWWGENILHVAAPAITEGRTLGAVVVKISLSGVTTDIQLAQERLDFLMREHSASFMLTGATLGVILVTLSILSAVGVAGGLSGPVVAFAARARRIGRGERVKSEPLERRDEIGDLSLAFDEMAAALERTTVSKDYVDNVLQSMADMLIVTDRAGRVLNVNPSCLAELGCSEEALTGKRIAELLPAFADLDSALVRPRSERPAWVALHSPGGSQIPVRVSLAPLRDAGGAISGQVFVMQNVADHLAAEEQMARALAEKEILLREIHHRVKNNLQIISSMLSLQGERSEDPEVREVFLDSEVRIRAMALVHEQLYRSGDLARIDLSEYLGTLALQVIRYFGREDCIVDVRVDDACREATVDQAIPVGLIVNELIANSVQHGFAGSRSGSIIVELVENADSRTLTVHDDGLGIPAGFEIETSDSLGLRLVQALTEQVGGSFRMTRDRGTRAVVEFPILRGGRSERRGGPAPAGGAAAADTGGSAAEAGGKTSAAPGFRGEGTAAA